jgi:hypothetical protein
VLPGHIGDVPLIAVSLATVTVLGASVRVTLETNSSGV